MFLWLRFRLLGMQPFLSGSQAPNCVPRCSKYSSTLVLILRLITGALYVGAEKGI